MKRLLSLACLWLAATCPAFAQEPKPHSADPFQPLLDHIAKQHGFWAQDNEKVAKVFHRCLDSVSKDKEKAVVRFVGDDNERAYWIGGYLTTPSYLNGHTARPYLALAIWADASERLAIKQKPTEDDKSHRVCLNILAATLAKRLGFNTLAVTLKKRAEAADSESIGSRPAVSGEDDRIYDSIDIESK